MYLVAVTLGHFDICICLRKASVLISLVAYSLFGIIFGVCSSKWIGLRGLVSREEIQMNEKMELNYIMCIYNVHKSIVFENMAGYTAT